MVSAPSEHNKDEAETPYHHETYKRIDHDGANVLPIGSVVRKNSLVEEKEREFDAGQCRGGHEKYSVLDLVKSTQVIKCIAMDTHLHDYALFHISV